MKRKIDLALLLSLATVALVAAPALAKKEPETRALEFGVESPEVSTMRGGHRFSVDTGAALRLTNLRYKVAPNDAETIGRSYLRDHAGSLGLRFADSSDLRLHAIRESLSGTTVRFRQQVDGFSVLGAEIAVTYNHDFEVRTVFSSYKPQAATFTAPAEKQTLAFARARALAHLGLAEGKVDLKTEQVVIIDQGRARLVQRFETMSGGELEGWELLVDAETGELVRARDTKAYVNGSGNAFLPDPLSSAEVAYNTPGYVDGSDADTAQLTAQTFPVTLLDITDTAGTFSLVGPWAEIIDHESPFNGLFSQAGDSSWDFLRNANAFEAAHTYYHIDTYMRYLNVTLGLDIRPYQYATGVRFDPSGLSGADNSHYTGGTGRLAFGEGGVDDAEDADVVIHELGHGLHDWVTSGGLSQVQGLSEGVGDYAAISYSRSFNQWTPADPAYNWTFSWDGHNPFWNGRVTNWNDTRVYPTNLVGQIHTDGQFWASCNVDILEQIGRERADLAHWEGLGRTIGSTNQEDAAQAVLDAAADLAFTVGEVTTMFTVYDVCGYNVTLPDVSTIFVDGFELGNTSAWSLTVP
jgi:zinc metalloprotease ZmpB